jgi:molybdate transport system regulatory protein
MNPHVKLFLSSSRINGIFGDGKFRLLQAVAQEGSLQRAAKRLGRAYRKVWSDLNRAEQGFGRKLVKRFRGGSGGGRTELTDYGKKLIKAWQVYESDMKRAQDRSFRKHLRKVIKK